MRHRHATAFTACASAVTLVVLVVCSVLLFVPGSSASPGRPAARVKAHPVAQRSRVPLPPPTTTAPPTTVPPAPTTTAPPPPTTAAPSPTTEPPAAPASPGSDTASTSSPGGYGCGAALAYLNAHAAPGFDIECPGDAEGHEAMTCIDVAGVCPGAKVIAIADPCSAAYMNEASNSWVLQGESSAGIDPYGYC